MSFDQRIEEINIILHVQPHWKTQHCSPTMERNARTSFHDQFIEQKLTPSSAKQFRKVLLCLSLKIHPLHQEKMRLEMAPSSKSTASQRSRRKQLPTRPLHRNLVKIYVHFPEWPTYSCSTSIRAAKFIEKSICNPSFLKLVLSRRMRSSFARTLPNLSMENQFLRGTTTQCQFLSCMNKYNL